MSQSPSVRAHPACRMNARYESGKPSPVGKSKGIQKVEIDMFEGRKTVHR